MQRDEKQRPRRMPSHKDEMDERLRKAREAAHKKRKVVPPQPKPSYIPYATMFKLEPWPRPHNYGGPCRGRQLQCVKCGLVLEWRIYTVAPDKFDEECSECGTDARDFWNEKPHKEIGEDGREEAE